MANIAVNGDRVDNDPTNGAIVTASVSFATVEGVPIITHEDSVAFHGSPPHAAAFMNKPTFFFTVDGRAVVIDGDAATCGHKIQGTGFVNVIP